MKKILLSVAVIGIAGVLAVNATSALFTDVERSTGNTFTAGEIDLKIDNTSYYSNTPGLYNSETSWLMKDLEEGKDFFFKFDDLKPGDWGEDTISIHVKDNDSWLCADVTLTSDDDNGLTEPEEGDGDATGGVGEGELADRVAFIWWADDGDNVLEVGEQLLPSGPLGVLEVGETATVPLADSMYNIWGDTGPLPGDDTRYIGKAWCFGGLIPEPLPQDDHGFVSAIGGNGPDERGTGFVCDGSVEDNITQTDSMTADISFRAVQSRNNTAFVCAIPDIEPDTGTLTIIKRVPTGDADPNDFDFDVTDVDGVVVYNDVAQGSHELEAGNYTVSEEAYPGYTADFLDCGDDGSVAIVAGVETVCTVVNTRDMATFSLDKTVTYTGSGIIVATTDFLFTIKDQGGNVVGTYIDGETPLVLETGEYDIVETYTGGTGFAFTTTYHSPCTQSVTGSLNGAVTLTKDAVVVCEVNNHETS